MSFSLSLRTQVISMVGLCLVFVLLLSFFTQSLYIDNMRQEDVDNAAAPLVAAAEVQVAELIPGVLLQGSEPGAIALMTERIRDKEVLLDARFVEGNAESIARCHRAGTTSYVCYDSDRSELRTVTWAELDGKRLGALVKRKRFNTGQFARIHDLFLAVVAIFAATMVGLILWLAFFLDKFVRQPLLGLKDRLAPVLEGGRSEAIESTHVREIDVVFTQVSDLVRQFQHNRTQAALGDFAAQVSHDIRSPLTALQLSIGSLPAVPQQHGEIIRLALGRIGEIAERMLDKKRRVSVATPGAVSPRMLIVPIRSIIAEKNVRFHDREIAITARGIDESYGVFARLDIVELKRVLSNLIDNAVDAIADSGSVAVSVSSTRHEVVAEVSDDGKGIAADILPRLMQEGATFGKPGGTGLGLFHARRSVEGWGGSITIASEVGKGTCVTIRLPRVAAPSWFVPELPLADYRTLVVIDDDETVYRAWRERLGTDILYFRSAEAFREWATCEPARFGEAYFLVDYDFGFGEATGLSLIESLGIARRACLVSARAGDDEIRTRCTAVGVGLLPKELIGVIPLRREEAR